MNQNLNTDGQNPLSERTRAILVIKYLLFSASIVPALVAGGLAYQNDHFSTAWFLLAGLGLLIGQAGADYLYYFFTHFHTDQRDAHTKIFAGWRPLFTGEIIKPEHTVFAGIACLAIDLIIGVYFYLQLGTAILFFAAIGGLVAVFFTPLMLRGLKEPIVFITFGPLCVISIYYVLTQSITPAAWIVSLPVGFLVTLTAYFKGTRYKLAQENGEEIILNLNRNIVAGLLILAYSTLLIAGITGWLNRWALLGLLTIPLAIVLYYRTATQNKIVDYLWATVYSLAILISTGLLMVAGFICSTIN